MPIDEGTTYIELRAKLDQLKRDLSEAERLAVAAGNSAAKKTETRWSKIGASLKRALPAVAKSAGLAVAAGLGYAIKAASDLNETISFTDVTFKEASGSMQEWGDSTLDTMGLAKQSALDAANGFGGLFQTTGATAEESAQLSQSMVQLATDMSSAKNVRLEDALLALKSGLIGEAEPMRKFNVLLSEAAVNEEAWSSGIAKRGAELTEAQKVQARMNIILQQTTDIQGDYARTQDSAANRTRKMQEQVKQLSGEIGQGLLPAFVSVLDKLSTFVDLVSEAAKAGERFDENVQSSETHLVSLALLLKEGRTTQEAFNNAVEGYIALSGEGNNNWLEEQLDGVYSGSVLASEAMEIVKDTILGLPTEELQRRLEKAGLSLGDVGEEAEETGEKVKKTQKVVETFAGMTNKKLKTWTADTVGGFNLVNDALGRLVEKHKVSAAKIKAILEKSLENQLEFGKNWAAVVDMAGPKAEEFLAYIQENFGAEAAQVVAVLADQNRAYLNDIVNTWARGEASAQRLAGVVGREFGAIRNQVHSTAATVGGLGAIIDRITAKFSGMAAAAQIKIATEPAPPRASGGPVLPMHSYLVGERGPEVIRMGSQGGTVIPNHRLGSSDMRISGTLTIPGLGRAILDGATLSLDSAEHRHGRMDRARSSRVA